MKRTKAVFGVLSITISIAGRAHASWIIPLLFLLRVPALVEAQYIYTAGNAAITITEYTGPGGAVTIPDAINGLPVTNIGDSAFYDCESLSSVIIPNSVISIGQVAFSYCTSLTSVTMGTSVASIGNGAFQCCSDLSSINIPNSVTSIGDLAFQRCNLASVTIPSSVNSIGMSAFMDCAILSGVYFEGNAPTVGYDVFEDDGFFHSLIVYYSAGTTGWGATFGGMPTSLWDPLSQLAYTINSGTVTITGYSGPGGSVTIPDTLEGIDVTSIGDSAFFNCFSLTGITIPNSVTSIADYAFAGCFSLASVTIPNGVTSIGNWAFLGCSSLSSVAIGSSVSSIGKGAFDDCSSLTGVYFQGNAPSADSTVFESVTNATAYFLPCASGWGAAFGGLPTVELNSITFTANGTHGVVPLMVNFTSPATDNCGHAITNWNWTFDDGSTSTVQNPSHTYTMPGLFFPSLLATDNAGLAVTGGRQKIQADFNSGLVLNGGFDTGDFTGWALSFDGPYDDLYTDVVDEYEFGLTPHSGDYEAALGTLDSRSYLSQTLATMAGARYSLSLWLDSPDAATPNEFLVSWNGTTLFDQTNIPAAGWTNLQFFISATGTNAVLEFAFRDDNSVLVLDDISVFPAPASASPGSAGVQRGQFGFYITGASNVAIVVEASTNLANPAWYPLQTNRLTGSSFYFSDPQWTKYQERYYRLRQP